MSYGPALPPHLQRQRDGNGGEEEHEDRFGSGSQEESDEEDAAYGPALPPHLRQGRDQERGEDDEEEQEVLGPRPPPGYSREAKADSESDDDGAVIGPLPPKPGEGPAASSSSSAAADVERRSRKMLDKIEGRGAAPEPKRETWMLELPAEKAKNFGLGPRQFSRASGAAESSGKKREARQAWAETPEMRAKRERGEAVDEAGDEERSDQAEDKDVLEYLASLKRDEEMEKVTKELREKRGTESLMEKHSKKLNKKTKKEKESGKTKERRPFDRDIDLQANRFDNAAKEAMLKRARQLDNRFSSGSSKYL